MIERMGYLPAFLKAIRSANNHRIKAGAFLFIGWWRCAPRPLRRISGPSLTVELPFIDWDEDDDGNEFSYDIVDMSDGYPERYKAHFSFDDDGFSAYRELFLRYDGTQYDANDKGSVRVSYRLTFEY